MIAKISEIKNTVYKEKFEKKVRENGNFSDRSFSDQCSE